MGRSVARRWLWIVAAVALTLPVISGAVTSTRVAGADEPAPAPRVDLGDNSGLERDAVNGSVFVPVTLSEPAAEPVVVSYHTVDGSAVAGTDYLAWGSPSQPRTVTIPAGRLQTTINVPVLSVGTATADTQFEVVATAVTGGGAVLGDATGVATIVDSDALSGPVPVISVSQPTISEGRSGQRLMQFQIHLSRATSSPLALTYATTDQSAQAGFDYVAKLPGSVVFAPGQISKTIDVLVNSDEAPGADRSFVLDVAVVGGPPVEELVTSAVATIRDDDVAPEPPGAVQLASGASHTCALLGDGSLRCWGANGAGQLGDGTTVSSVVPVAVAGPTGVAQVAAGGGATCARSLDGTLRCWGAVINSSTALPVSGIAGAIDVATSGAHSCAVLGDGSVRCWGANTAGQLGDGTTTNSTGPVVVSGITTAVDVSVGSVHSCAILADGSGRCWGTGAGGRLGNGGTANSSTPVVVTGLAGATSVTLGATHSCALLATGAARCWGTGTNGRLGNGSTASATTPVTVTGLAGAAELAAGSAHTCARLTDGAVRCWGSDSRGQLGNAGSSSGSTTPSTVGGLTASGLSVGGDTTCVLQPAGVSSCWGDNTQGQVGNGASGAASSTPVAAAVPSNAVQASVGGDIFGNGCAAFADGTARCWGSRQYLSLGNGTVRDSGLPLQVSGLTTVTQVGTGTDRACALLIDGTVRCWGYVLYDAFLDLTGRSTVPVTVPSLSGVTQIAVGGLHACALRSDGTVWCWGTTFNGRLGSSFGTDYVPTPVQVPGLVGIAEIAAGYAHTCARSNDGTVRCWGVNSSGNLGGGTVGGSSATPVPVVGVADAASISGSCAVAAAGTVSCWGGGSGTPSVVAGLSGVAKVTSGSGHSCAVLGDGTARCWGANTFGKLGDGTTTSSTTPVTVSGVTGVVDITAGPNQSCAVLAAGGVRCWGDNFSGELGNGGALVPLPSAVVGLP